MDLHKTMSLLALVILLCFCRCNSDCTPPDQCYIAPETGPCYALIKKYYFNKEEGKCMEFTWGGCGGSVPFETLDTCRDCECN